MTSARFAPSPTGLLHLGHAYAARVACEMARRHDGRYLLRFEDIDHTRVRPEYYDFIRDDLEFLGLTADEETPQQLKRLGDHEAALQHLRDLGALYPCFCTRREIQEELKRMPTAPHGPEGPLYPGTCRALKEKEVSTRIAGGEIPAWRLDSAAVAAELEPLTFTDLIHGMIPVDPLAHGDLILSRKDIGTSYHIAVVVDDAADGITHVTRGEDLLGATHIHRVLQTLLKLPEPLYLHHELVHDEMGRRLAKRDDARSIQQYRETGKSSEQILAMLPALPAPLLDLDG